MSKLPIGPTRRTAQAASGSPPAPRGLGAWLAVVSTYQTCSEVLSTRLKPLGLNLAQHEVLLALLRAPGQTQQKLAAGSYLTKGHMSAVLVDMEAAGLLRRSGSEVDKRHKLAELTDTGRQLANAALAVQSEVVNAMMAPLDDGQIDLLKRTSEQAQSALKAL